MTETATNPWDTADYQRIQEARGNGSTLEVSFEDGARVELELSQLVGRTLSADPDWDELVVGAYELMVPIGGEQVTRSWMNLRLLTDPDLAAFFSEQAASEAADVGSRIRSLRKARWLSGKELAKRAGLAPQSLSRIERGRSDPTFSMLQRLLAAMDYSLSDLEDLDGPEIDAAEVESKLVGLGLDQASARRALFGTSSPSSLQKRTRRIYGWSITDLTSSRVPPILAPAAAGGRFKEHIRGRQGVAPYVAYAYAVAAAAVKATPTTPHELPRDAGQLRKQVKQQMGDLRFGSLARVVWEAGIPVVPLRAPGQFHGACWLIDGRPVIVLKQSLDLDSRWAFDLGHELGHVLRHLSLELPSIVELEELGWSAHQVEEAEATDFSKELLLGDPQLVAERAVEAADGFGPRLKAVLPSVAQEFGVEPGVLANYLAARMETGGHGNAMWATAQKLQQEDRNALAEARELLLEFLELDQLDEDSRWLVQGAIADDGELDANS